MKIVLSALLFLTIVGCVSPYANGNRVGTGWTGQGWYQEGKTPEQMNSDYFSCKAQAMNARDMADQTLSEMYCMQSKGYRWQ